MERRQVEALMSEWAREPCLYNIGHSDYMKNKKGLAEKRIVVTLNENTPDDKIGITGNICITMYC